MKTIVTLAALALALPASAYAAAAQWYRVGGHGKAMTYVDKASIRQLGEGREAWVMTVLAQPINERVWSARIRYAFDCTAGYYRSLHYVHYGQDGTVLSDHASSTSAEKRYPDKGAVSESMVNFVCQGTGGETVADPHADAASRFTN